MEDRINPLVRALFKHALMLSKNEIQEPTTEAYMLAVIYAVCGRLSLPVRTSIDDVKAYFIDRHIDIKKAGEELAKYIEKETLLESIRSRVNMRFAMASILQEHNEISALLLVEEILKYEKTLAIKLPEINQVSSPIGLNGLGIGPEIIIADEDDEDFLEDDIIVGKDLSDLFDEEDDEDLFDDDDEDIFGEDEDEEDENKASVFVVDVITERAKSLQEALSQKVFGQDAAVNMCVSGFFQSELRAVTEPDISKPKGTFLFAGPPGVGKTFLAESFAKELGRPFMRVDMSGYSDKEATLEFSGSDKVYKDGKSGNITSFVQKNPDAVILFDEIEKAHINVIHLFLQILDAGHLRDAYMDKDVSFKDTLLFFTTNAGRPLYEDSDMTDFSNVSRKVILNALRKDINPLTEEPYFPEAICSRFSSGNVIMFNHISASYLLNIAHKRIVERAQSFSKKFGIKFGFDDEFFTTLLYSEGGTADARHITSRSEALLYDELFELFRLLDVSGNVERAKIERIDFKVELPKEGSDERKLYEEGESLKALILSDKKTLKQCSSACKDFEFICVGGVDEAKDILDDTDIRLVLIDMSYKLNKTSTQYLNIEDSPSPARDLLHYMNENGKGVPVYILQTLNYRFNREEKLSFADNGSRGIIDIETIGAELKNVRSSIYRQDKMLELAKSNRLVTFETAQTISEDGKTAQIRLFDIKLTVAVDSEDSKNVLSNVSKPDVHFDDIIGADDAKDELKFFINYLKNPKKYREMGAGAPKGVLLYGPPGTGKTMLAKAMACEADVTFINAEANQFLKRYVGEGPEKVHEIFATARKYAPTVLFIDEIDAIAKARTGSEQAESREEILTAFLTEMDGFKTNPDKPVFVLAATNFEVEEGHAKSLDPALMRRFDRRIYVDLPGKKDREKYLKQRVASNKMFDISEDKIANIAIRSAGMSLALLDSVFELAIREALRNGKTRIDDVMFDDAFETFNNGETKSLDPSRLERTARHEAGHALICYLSGEKPSYLTVVARADHGGYMRYGDNENKGTYTKEELLWRIRTALGGRACEMVYYGNDNGLSTGASGDLASATNVAKHIICTYGMSEEFGLATIGLSALSGEMELVVRDEINKMLKCELDNTIELINKNRDKIDMLVDALVRENHLGEKQISEILA